MIEFSFGGIDWEVVAYTPGRPGYFDPRDGGSPPEPDEIEVQCADPVLVKDYPDLVDWMLDRHIEDIEEAALRAIEDRAVEAAETAHEY